MAKTETDSVEERLAVGEGSADTDDTENDSEEDILLLGEERLTPVWWLLLNTVPVALMDAISR